MEKLFKKETVVLLLGTDPLALKKADKPFLKYIGLTNHEAEKFLSILEWNKALSQPSILGKIRSSQDIYNMYSHLSLLDYEEFHVVFLKRNNGIIKKQKFTIGTSVRVVVDVQRIIRTGLNLKANALIFVHNHPSGQLLPSSQDRNITERLKNAADLFDQKVLDHVIIAGDSYTSFADEGIL